MRLFGLIGSPLTHSFSKKYFADKFSREAIPDSHYELFPLASIDELPALLAAHPSLCGLNVTIPYKEQVLAFADDMDETVQQVKAANCIRITNGKLSAFNTDVIGFEKSLMDKWSNHHQRALVLGTGGASKAVHYVLEKLGLQVQSVSRTRSASSISYEDITPGIMYDHTLVVNTTPLGTYPAVDGLPPLPYEAVTKGHYFFDLVYNPPVTRFLAMAAERGAVTRNGHDMLEIQAEESWKIWKS